MSQMFGHLWARRARMYRAAPVSGGAPLVPALLPLLPATGLALLYQPEYSAPALSGGRVTSVASLAPAAHVATEWNGAGTGPKEITDWLGRKCWRFDQENSGQPDILVEGLRIADTFASAAANYNRNFTYWFVVRIHRQSSGSTALWNFTDNTGAIRANGPNVTITLSSNMVRGQGAIPTDGRLVAGSQLQVIGVNSRPTVNGGQRIYLNSRWVEVAQAGAQTAAFVGALIGASTCGMDMYAAAIYTPYQSDADAALTYAALMSTFKIVDFTKSLTFTGDSLTAGFNAVSSGVGSAMRAAEVLPGNWRVNNTGTSGNQTSDLVTRAATIMAGYHASLTNIMSMQIGFNDMTGGARSAAATYNGGGSGTNNIVYLTGLWLAAGYTCLHTTNIATTNPTLYPKVVTLRGLIRAAQFLTDTQSNAGQTYDGKLRVMDAALIQDAGAERYNTDAQAGNGAYYDNTDGVHPTIYGTGPLFQAIALDAVAWRGA